MNWRVVVRPEVEQDIADAVRWYEARQSGLGIEFVEEIIRVWDALVENPLLNARRHQVRHDKQRESGEEEPLATTALNHVDKRFRMAAVRRDASPASKDWNGNHLMLAQHHRRK